MRISDWSSDVCSSDLTVAITEPRPGVFVYDFGKNCSSRPALTVRGPAGSTIKLSPSEVLGVDGLIDPRSIGARPNLPVCYNYTLAGRGDETWRPRFTYCGSRYLKVAGAKPADRAGPNAIAVVALAREFVHHHLHQGGRVGARRTERRSGGKGVVST